MMVMASMSSSSLIWTWTLWRVLLCSGEKPVWDILSQSPRTVRKLSPPPGWTLKGFRPEKTSLWKSFQYTGPSKFSVMGLS